MNGRPRWASVRILGRTDERRDFAERRDGQYWAESRHWRWLRPSSAREKNDGKPHEEIHSLNTARWTTENTNVYEWFTGKPSRRQANIVRSVINGTAPCTNHGIDQSSLARIR